MHSAGFQFDNIYTTLPNQFYSHQRPTPVHNPQLIRINQALAEQLNVSCDWLASEAGVNVLAGNKIAEGSTPIATVYAGHQFGMWNPQLGDGRAVLLGEVIDQHGQRFDVQLKGSGQTPYSRSGDGRAPLGPVLREYIVSEAMHALGIPTTRSLAAVASGESVWRDSELPGAILTRIAKSHIRVGTFEFFASRQDLDSLRILADHVIQRHYPDAQQADNPYQALLEMVLENQASLIAQWQGIGFIHGVMNTDNMLLSGETVDYGPCAFMDHFHPATCFSSIDQQKRYAYGNQPQIGHWNIACLAQCLLLIMDKSETRALKLTQETVDLFPKRFAFHYLNTMRKKLGLLESVEDDQDLLLNLLEQMEQSNLDFTLTFRHLADRLHPNTATNPIGENLFELPQSMKSWLQKWQQRGKQEKANLEERQRLMHQANPALIPRNHQVEAAIHGALVENNLERFHKLVDVLEKPFEFNDDLAEFALPPNPDQVVENTFCGT